MSNIRMCIASEVENHNIQVSCVCRGSKRSPLSEITNTSEANHIAPSPHHKKLLPAVCSQVTQVASNVNLDAAFSCDSLRSPFKSVLLDEKNTKTLGTKSESQIVLSINEELVSADCSQVTLDVNLDTALSWNNLSPSLKSVLPDEKQQ